MSTALYPPGAKVGPGAAAPDASLIDIGGSSVRLSEYWSRRPIVLVFLRHFGCTFCREQVAELRQDYAKFQALDAEVVCIAQGDAKTGKAFSIFFDLPFPLLLSGEDTSVYRDYGLERGTLGQLFGLRSWTHGIAATLRGHLIGKRVGDGFQMPGVFVVDAQGVIRYAHRHKDAADNPGIGELLQATRSLGEG